MTNQPNLTNQNCPYCEGTGRIKGSVRCPACEGFKIVGEVGLNRSRLFEALDKKRRRGELPPPDFNTEDCYF
jgi:RecJ-like exonuclease